MRVFQNWPAILLALAFVGCVPSAKAPAPSADGAYHVHPGDDIQQFLDIAAKAPNHKKIVVHSGVYRPARLAQAMLQFNAEHDGIVLEAAGDVTLTAANSELAEPGDESFPAAVSHVVYFGHGVSSDTMLRGFRITGANGYLGPREESRPLEPHSAQPELRPGLFFYLDGGAIKIFGQSYPTIEGCTIEDNYMRLCGGGVSVEHRGFKQGFVQFRDCIFRNNRCPATGPAIDLLEGSAAKIENCLFVGNIGNTGMEQIAQQFGLRYNEQHGSGALTVFPNSSVEVVRCTFTGNWNGADDRGAGNVYFQNIFWDNTAGDGSRPGDCYELDIIDASKVTECHFHGRIEDLRGTVSREANVFSATDPEFDEAHRPRSQAYQSVGYRPR